MKEAEKKRVPTYLSHVEKKVPGTPGYRAPEVL